MTPRAKRSLKATPEGIKRANEAVLTYATKMELAAELEISRATVQNFFAGKAIGRENFHKICQKLELPWQEIAQISSGSQKLVASNQTSNPDSDSLVSQLRHQLSRSIEQRCGMMRVLDMSQPLELDEIYTNVNILERISGRRRLELTDLLKVCAAEEFDRPGLGRSTTTPVLGVTAVKKFAKLIVLGKPGAGKTTFLKHVALQCNRGELQAQRLPIFITLKDFAETEQQPGLLEYINQQFATNGITHKHSAEQILTAGKALVLLDGLDEVRESDSYRVLQEVRQFTQKYHQNHFVISCRLATREYTLEEFTEVEVADFSSGQIDSFALKWFAAKDPAKSRKFSLKLQSNPPILELATNPLLLTLLCLIFEESADFPANRSELYKEGLNVLLRKWDAKRNIERQQIYKKLSVPHKEDLLGQIAYRTFLRGDYFFRQQELEQQIGDYLRHLPNVNPQPPALAVDSEAVLKSIEAQHGLLVERARGIYSFSHLTFQEYFTAREIVAASDPQALETSLQQLTCRIAEPRWREVFLLCVEMLRNADYLLQLMQQQLQRLLGDDPQLQGFLAWVEQKAQAVNTPYKSATVRAFYFDLDLARAFDLVGGSLDLARSLDFDLARTLTFDIELALDRALARALALIDALNLAFERSRALDRVLALARVLNAILALALVRVDSCDCELKRSLQQLKQQLSSAAEDGNSFKSWWQINGQAWTEQLRAVMISHRQLGYDWQFSEQQRQLLQQYYDASKLLVDCLNSARYVTRSVRQQIEDTLLLPTRSASIAGTGEDYS